MPPKRILSIHWRGSWAISRRIVQAAIFGPSLYIALAIIILGAMIPIRSFQSLLQAQGAATALRPFDVSIIVACILITIYLAFSSLITIAQDREQGTLDVLFFGPIDVESYLIGQFLGQWLQSILLFGAFGLYLVILSRLTGLIASWQVVISLIASLITSSAVISLGMLFAVLVKRTRGAVVTFFVCMAILLGLQIGSTFLLGTSLPVMRNYEFLASLIKGIQWLLSVASPFYYLTNSLDAAAKGDLLRYGLVLAEAVIYTLGFTGMGIFFLSRRGVHP